MLLPRCWLPNLHSFITSSLFSVLAVLTLRSVVTLALPPSSSSLKITDRSFRYASPCLWNQLPLSLRQPHSGTSFDLPTTHHFFLFCFTTLFIHNSLSFTSSIKPTCFTNPIPCSSTSYSRTAFTDFCLHCFF